MRKIYIRKEDKTAIRMAFDLLKLVKVHSPTHHKCAEFEGTDEQIEKFKNNIIQIKPVLRRD